ncbi:unnamed protein product [Cylicocyclus nassatus]|uniref:Uncharacterized protein n=1 Tax=Cylicocyclus nassatus TaxID=53992 RepID=A0AA36DP85_CYLNA|nr:unnamed protein product [Cylicocyclus nassatus]
MKRAPLLQFVRKCSSRPSSSTTPHSAVRPHILRTATQTKAFPYVEQLTNYLKNNFILHEPGRFLIIPKPYGVSCVGEPQKEGGVFENSVYDRKDTDDTIVRRRNEREVTISECLPGLSRHFNEPNLTFCTGLKRYLSGAIVLPANVNDFENMKKSIKYTLHQPRDAKYHYNGLAILMGSPPSSSGTLSGYATFQSNGKLSEYIFVEKPSTKRARSGKFAVAGTMSWQVLSRKHGCTLVEFGTNKFARHLPRLMFSHMLCPILGDELYCSRLTDLDGHVATIQPKDLHRIRGKRYVPTAFSERLGIPAEELGKLPMYCHIHSTVFPRFGWIIGRPKSEQDVADLYANAPPPQHFLAMVQALGMSADLERYFHEDEGEDQACEGLLGAMTYRLPVHTIICIALIASFVPNAVADVKFNFRQIAGRCCSAERETCCEQAIKNRQPLNCSMTLEALVALSDCIQKEMFGARSLELARIQDAECCQVFANELLDPGGTCVETCVRALRTPSLRSVDTLRTIKSCRADNEDYKCFRRCQSFLRTRNSSADVFPYLAVCDLSSRLEKNVLYIGPDLEE